MQLVTYKAGDDSRFFRLNRETGQVWAHDGPNFRWILLKPPKDLPRGDYSLNVIPAGKGLAAILLFDSTTGKAWQWFDQGWKPIAEPNK
jgi:hypothetical protein